MNVRFTSGLAVLLSIVVVVVAQTPKPLPNPLPRRLAGPMTTREHLHQSAWWPTMAFPDQKDYVGTATCAKCHAGFVTSQQTSQMARTLQPASSSAVIDKHQGRIFDLGAYSYTLHNSGHDATMSVSDGAATKSAVLEWAFGSGDVGQSYLWTRDGHYGESRFNYFATSDSFGPTPGRLHGTPVSIDMALGRNLAGFEARTCFSCHTTALTAAEPLHTAPFVPGVTCEACHGPGKQHLAGFADDKADNDLHILNPAHLSPVDAVDFCGACHSTPKDVQLMGAVGEPTVRFPAYRLEGSRCWGKSGDDRITCTACHDPHQPLEHQAAAYDKACLRCHLQDPHDIAQKTQLQSACPVAKKNCVTCHMPKVEVTDMHYKFTDHRIRVVKAGAPFPG